jgi:hypothetical protein
MIAPGDGDPRHGKVAGYMAACPCAPCRAAKTRYEKWRRVHGQPLRINSLPTQRRIRALAAIGWPFSELSRHLGFRGKEYPQQLLRRPRVNVATARKVADLYDRLSMTPGPSQEARTRAAAKGWAPPLAWDDIDDPHETPQGVQLTPLGRRAEREALIEAVRDLLEAGESPTSIADRLNRSPRTLARMLHRHAPDLAPRFNSEETRSRAA